MNRDVCGHCGAPAELCQCVPSTVPTWPQLRRLFDLIEPPASLPFAVCAIAWLLCRDDRRAMTKHYYIDAGIAEETARKIMDYLRANGWAETRAVPGDQRVVLLFPSKKLLEALYDR